MTELLDSRSSSSGPASQTPTRHRKRAKPQPQPQRRRGPAKAAAAVRPERRSAAEPQIERNRIAPKASKPRATEPIDFGPLPIADEPGITKDERRKRLEQIVVQLAQTPDFASRLSNIYKRHTRREITAAAALRPDLMPTLNGEFEHFAFFAA